MEVFSDNFEKRGERLLDFEEYRNVCDGVDDFRKVGIQSLDTYELAINDPGGVIVDMSTGSAPLLSSIETEKMYNEARCRDMLGGRDVKLLAIPVGVIKSQLKLDQKILLPKGLAVIVEDFKDDRESFVDLSQVIANDIQLMEFINDDLVQFEENASSWMAAYSVVPGSDKGSEKYGTSKEFSDKIVDIWKSVRTDKGLELQPDNSTSGVFFFSNEDLQNRPDVIEGLWSVSSFGFGEKLGKGHPLSMEFNRESFDKQITSSSAMTAAYFENGEALCFSFISPSFEDSDWLNLNSGVMRKFFKDAEDNNRVPLHWFELISKGERGMGYADNVLQEFMNLAVLSKNDFQVFFESTNLSSLYIPDIVRSQIEKTDDLSMREDVRQIGKLNYYAILT